MCANQYISEIFTVSSIEEMNEKLSNGFVYVGSYVDTITIHNMMTNSDNVRAKTEFLVGRVDMSRELS